MNKRLFKIIEPKRELLKQLQDEMEEEFLTYVDTDDFMAVVLLKAIQDLDL